MLEEFCFINKGYNIVKVAAENINNISIPNIYCKVFPCILSLEKNISNIEDLDCSTKEYLSNIGTRVKCSNARLIVYNGNAIGTISFYDFYKICNILNYPIFYKYTKKSFTTINKITHKNISAAPVDVNKTIDNYVMQKYTVPVNVTRTVQASPMLRTINKTVTENLNRTITKYVPFTETCINKTFVYIPETSIINPSPVYNINNQTLTKYINNTFTENINTTKLDKIDFINKTTYNDNFLPCLNQTYGNTSLQNEIKHILG